MCRGRHVGEKAAQVLLVALSVYIPGRLTAGTGNLDEGYLLTETSCQAAGYVRPRDRSNPEPTKSGAHPELPGVREG